MYSKHVSISNKEFIMKHRILLIVLCGILLSFSICGAASALSCSKKASQYCQNAPAATSRPEPTPSPVVLSDSPASEIIAQVNAERAKYGLNPLKNDPVLASAASVRCGEIIRKFSHTRPDGSAWSTVSGKAKGENIAMGYNSVDKVMAAWLTSDGHRANILRGSFASIGVCACRYNGVWYWVQLFGR